MANILIIEDNKVLSQAYRLILEKEGHTVRVAFNGKEGLEKAKNSVPQLILLDILMPVMDGVEFLKKYQPHSHPDTSIIILSNLNQDAEVQKALELGAHTYVQKATTSPKKLVAYVKKATSKSTTSGK